MKFVITFYCLQFATISICFQNTKYYLIRVSSSSSINVSLRPEKFAYFHFRNHPRIFILEKKKRHERINIIFFYLKNTGNILFLNLESEWSVCSLLRYKMNHPRKNSSLFSVFNKIYFSGVP